MRSYTNICEYIAMLAHRKTLGVLFIRDPVPAYMQLRYAFKFLFGR